MSVNYFCFFTDGATEPTNPGPSGYAFVETKGYEDTNELFSFYASIGHSTNNIAELMAIRAVLEHILSDKEKYLSNRHAAIDIYSDSKYSLSCILSWYDSWVQNEKLDGKKNVELIADTVRKYKKVKSNVRINLRWVKGHSGVFGNERCDKLASMGVQLNEPNISVHKELLFDAEDENISVPSMDERIEYVLSVYGNKKDDYLSECILKIIDAYQNMF